MKNIVPPFTVSKIEEDIALVEFSGENVDLDSIIMLYDEIEKIANGKKIGIMNTFPGYMNYDEEATKYSASERPPKILFASAIVVESMSIRLIIMMFMRFNKQRMPRQVFNSKTKALAWLREMRSKNSTGLK